MTVEPINPEEPVTSIRNDILGSDQIWGGKVSPRTKLRPMIGLLRDVSNDPQLLRWAEQMLWAREASPDSPLSGRSSASGAIICRAAVTAENLERPSCLPC